MNGSKLKDDKEIYLTYSVVVRHADNEKIIEGEIVTKKLTKFIVGGPKDLLEWVRHYKQLPRRTGVLWISFSAPQFYCNVTCATLQV